MTRFALHWGAACMAILLLACSPQPADDLTGVPPGAQALAGTEIETILRESYSGVDDAQRVVLRTADGWTGFWEQVYSVLSPQPDAPAIDFGGTMVIAAAAGTRPSGGYSIDIEGIHVDAGAYYVVVRETAPGPGCITTAAITAPVVAVALPSSDAEVVFVERKTIHDC
jgi:hypothetical protein